MSKWTPVTSNVPQGSILGEALFPVFISDPGSGAECTLSRFAGLCGAVDNARGVGCIQRNLSRLEKWPHVNLMKFNEAKGSFSVGTCLSGTLKKLFCRLKITYLTGEESF